jgi:hypothetical protein
VNQPECLMRRSRFAFALLGVIFAAACGQSQVVITAEIEVANPDGEGMVVRPLADTEVELIPFDRDAIFDSLTAAYAIPEPEVPADLLEAQAAIAAAQSEWLATETQWATLRDRLQSITEEMEGMARGEARYVELFREFQDGDGQLSNVERQKDRAFQAFTGLQEGYMARADSMRLMQEQWADEAFAEFWDVFDIKQRERGRDLLADTTDAGGIAGPIEVPPGQWWVHARHELPFSVLYWNLPITVEGKEPIQVLLNRASAQVRPKL